MSNQNAITTRPDDKLKAFMRSPQILERFQEILGDRGARAYVSSVLLAVANNDALQECSHASIVSSALRAATLSLSCDPAIGQAYLVPFGRVATFVVGYKGLRDMALRTNKYRYIHVDKIYNGEGVDIDRITGAARMMGGKESDEIIGWVASFETTNGFRKTIYMSKEEIHIHAKKYSKGYDRPSGVWKQNPAAMEKKTVLRQLLMHWGALDSRDELLMNMYDEAEAEDLDVIESEFIPGERETHTEAELMAGLGYEPAPAPVATEETYPMSMELAEKETDSKGKPYIEYTDEELATRAGWIERAIKKEQDADKRNELIYKRDAIATILRVHAALAAHPAPTP